MTITIDRGTDRLQYLPTTSVDELETHASLMTRTDRKYVVPSHVLPDLIDAIAGVDTDLRVLQIGGRRSHRYASTYLDTPDLEGYWRTARRRRRRFKVRSRDYLDTGMAFTEVKTRGPRGATIKNRVPRSVGPVDAPLNTLPDADARFVRSELCDAGLPHVDVAALVPTLRTSYTRSTVWLPSSGARVTTDVDLAWSLPWDETVKRAPGLAILETKSAGAGTGIDRALWARGHRPVRISKYGTGLALMLPRLPAHRWHRVLTHHLQPLAHRDPV